MKRRRLFLELWRGELRASVLERDNARLQKTINDNMVFIALGTIGRQVLKNIVAGKYGDQPKPEGDEPPKEDGGPGEKP